MTRARVGMALGILLVPSLAGAQGLYLPDHSSRLPWSARAAGMGGAVVALAWGDAPEAWANPAFAAIAPGLRFVGHGAPMPSDPRVTDARWSGTQWGASAFGTGVVGGKSVEEYGVYTPPDSISGAQRFDLGSAEVRSLAWGASLHGMTRPLRGGGQPRPWWWWWDAGVGVARRELRQRSPLAPGGEATLADWGAYLRWTPFVDPVDAGSDGHRVDVAYAHAVQNWKSDRMTFAGSPVFQTLPRTQRDGLALRYAYRRGAGDGLSGTLRAPLNAGLDPALELTLSWELERVAPRTGTGGAYDITREGAEVEVLRLAALRVGHVDSPGERLSGLTWGAGLSLPYGRVAGVRWDWASEPRVRLERQDRATRQSVAAWLDPLVWWQGRRAR